MKRLMIGLVVGALAATSGAAAQSTKSTGQTTKAPAKAAGQATKAPGKAAAAPAASKAALRTPAALKAVAPAVFEATFTTTAGDFVIEVHRDWAPKGADRFYNLVKNGYYDDCRFFRVIPNFMVQFGINGDPAIQRNWMEANITDDPVKESNKRGFITFAKSGAPNSRTTQVFINYVDNSRLDADGFAPFGQVISGMNVVAMLNAQYGGTPSDQQQRIQAEGNAFLNKAYPKLDYVKTATITKGAAPAPKAPVKKP